VRKVSRTDITVAAWRNIGFVTPFPAHLFRLTIILGADTSGLEWTPGPKEPQTFILVHRYLLVEQGVHIGEFHNLENLARPRVRVLLGVPDEQDPRHHAGLHAAADCDSVKLS
jgi:hypothetical protein